MKSLLNALHAGRLVEIPEAGKEKSLRYLAHLIEAIPDFSGAADFAEAILAREASSPSALGMGVACPHVRVSGAGEILCAAGWSPAGIEYGATDGKKVHLVVMYAIPDAQKGAYLREISSLAAAVAKEGGIQAIATALELGTVRERLLDWVSSAIDTGVPDPKARMIRLEARQAAAERPVAAGLVQVLPVLIVQLPGPRCIVLCQSAELMANLEADATLVETLRQRGQFDRLGFRLVPRTVTPFDTRSLYEYLAVKLG